VDSSFRLGLRAFTDAVVIEFGLVMVTDIPWLASLIKYYKDSSSKACTTMEGVGSVDIGFLIPFNCILIGVASLNSEIDEVSFILIALA